VEKSIGTIAEAEERLRGKVRIDYVVPDYYARYPKACMGGWAQRLILIDPAGRALPCHAARVIPGIEFEHVQRHSLEWIWRESTAFNKFRGEDWMAAPCRSCERRSRDFGGCRCQAFLLAGDANATDPVCSLSPFHAVVEKAIQRSNRVSQAGILDQSLSSQTQPWSYRLNPR
jgi:pyrroloquinoline quinone biosynthesis protein E